MDADKISVNLREKKEDFTQMDAGERVQCYQLASEI